MTNITLTILTIILSFLTVVFFLFGFFAVAVINEMDERNIAQDEEITRLKKLNVALQYTKKLN